MYLPKLGADLLCRLFTVTGEHVSLHTLAERSKAAEEASALASCM